MADNDYVLLRINDEVMVSIASLVDLLDSLEEELWRLPFTPSPDHLCARRLLEQLGRR